MTTVISSPLVQAPLAASPISEVPSGSIDILVIGFGALGAIYSYILSQNENVRITALARGSYDAVSQGLTIDSEKFGRIEGWKPYRVVKEATEANDRQYKYIIATFKCIPDLLPSAAVLSPFLDGPHAGRDGETGPTVVLIQNGIGIEHPVQDQYPNTPIISVVAWIGANLLPGGVVSHGMLEKLVMGLYVGEGIEMSTVPTAQDEPLDELFGDPAGYKAPGGAKRRQEGERLTNEFAALLRSGGGEAEVVPDIQAKRYIKNMWNAAWSTMATLARAPISALVSPEVLGSTLPVVRRIGLEVLYVAREWGYSEEVLPLKSIDDAIKITIQNYQIKTDAHTPATPGLRADAFGGYGFSFPPQGPGAPGFSSSTAEFKPSMLLDIEAGRPCELEPILGSLLDRARAKALETPRLDMAYATIKVFQDAAVRKAAARQDIQEHTKSWSLRKPSVAGGSRAGKKEWEKAITREAAQRALEVGKAMRGNAKVTGKPVKAEEV